MKMQHQNFNLMLHQSAMDTYDMTRLCQQCPFLIRIFQIFWRTVENTTIKIGDFITQIGTKDIVDSL